MIITYEELTKALVSIGLISPSKKIIDCNYCYEGKTEKLKLRFAGEKPDVIIRKEVEFTCSDCRHAWTEPARPVNLNCPRCASEKVSTLFVETPKNN